MWDIRVGRNARANDILTWEESGGRDWFLHARDSSGPHVVISDRSDDPPRPPMDVIARAARLATGLTTLRCRRCRDGCDVSVVCLVRVEEVCRHRAVGRVILPVDVEYVCAHGRTLRS